MPDRLFEGKFLDRFTSVDERLAELNQLLRDVLAKKPEMVIPPVTEIPRDALSILQQILVEIRSMSFTTKDKPIFTYFTYPATGDRKTVGKGTTTIDFLEGKVSLPDGTEEFISDSLRAHLETQCRSVFVEASEDCKIQFDQYGKYPIDAEDFFLMTWMNFSRITLFTTKNTDIMVEASTNPETILRKLKMPSTKLLLPITRTPATKDLSTGALSKTTELTSRFKLLSVLAHFDSAVSPTVTVTFDSSDGSNYDTVLKKNTLSSATDYVFIGGDGYVFEADDQIKVDITSVAASVYLTIFTRKV